MQSLIDTIKPSVLDLLAQEYPDANLDDAKIEPLVKITLGDQELYLPMLLEHDSTPEDTVENEGDETQEEEDAETPDEETNEEDAGVEEDKSKNKKGENKEMTEEDKNEKGVLKITFGKLQKPQTNEKKATAKPKSDKKVDVMTTNTNQKSLNNDEDEVFGNAVYY